MSLRVEKKREPEGADLDSSEKRRSRLPLLVYGIYGVTQKARRSIHSGYYDTAECFASPHSQLNAGDLRSIISQAAARPGFWAK
jgi:hypothetical protein